VLRAALIAISLVVSWGLRPAPSLAANAAPENDCAEIDLRADLGDPRVQDGTSWCYAHSAADLLTQAVGKRISSYDLAITYLLGNEKKLRKAGKPLLSEYLKSHPDFEQRVHDSRLEEEAYQPEHLLGADGIIDTGGKDDQAIMLSNLKGLCLSERLPGGEANLQHYLEAIRDDYKNEDKKDVPTDPIGAVVNDVAKIMARAFQRWVDLKCGQRLVPKNPLIPLEISVADNLDEFKHLVASGEIVPREARPTLIAELNRVLDTKRAAAVFYESYDLYPHSVGKGAVNPHGDHSSIVAARKKISGVCHYFVRNHFGATCGYLPEYEPLCEQRNGGVWVPIGALKHLYGVISVR
jgi:hypothetical protein